MTDHAQYPRRTSLLFRFLPILSRSRLASIASMPSGRSRSWPFHFRLGRRSLHLIGSAAVPGEIGQCPDFACPPDRKIRVAEQARAIGEKQAAPRSRVAVQLHLGQRLLGEQHQPALLHRREFRAGHHRQNMRRERLQHRFGGRRRLVQPLERLPPPGEPHLRDHRLGAGGEDRGEAGVKPPSACDSPGAPAAGNHRQARAGGRGQIEVPSEGGLSGNTPSSPRRRRRRP